MGLPINTILFLLLVAGLLIVQVFLSKMQSKWPGLIMPGVYFLLATAIGVGRLFYNIQTTLPVILGDLAALVLFNIPTAVLMVIYFSCRKKAKQSDEIKRMNIQDL
jgi:hypothetical protein